MNTTYCSRTGMPYQLDYDDKLSIGMHKRGSHLSIPLGEKSWSTMVKQNSLQIILTDDSQIDLLIERLTKLKALKVKYNSCVEEEV